MIREFVAGAFRRACFSQMPDFAAVRKFGEPQGRERAERGAPIGAYLELGTGFSMHL